MSTAIATPGDRWMHAVQVLGEVNDSAAVVLIVGLAIVFCLFWGAAHWLHSVMHRGFGYALAWAFAVAFTVWVGVFLVFALIGYVPQLVLTP